MNALRAMYGLRRVCLAVTALLLSASTIHLLNLPSDAAASHLSRGLHDLKTLEINHPFAARCVDIIRGLASKWNIALPEDAIAPSASRSSGQLAWPSPTSSTFWAASIPAEKPSGGARSSGSTSSHRDSPFPPPPHPQSQRQALLGSFFNDPIVPLDSIQAQNSFWTPFSGQTMPMPPQHIVPSMSMDFNTTENQSTQWPMFGGATPGSESHVPHNTLQQPELHVDQSLRFEDWQWQ